MAARLAEGGAIPMLKRSVRQGRQEHPRIPDFSASGTRGTRHGISSIGRDITEAKGPRSVSFRCSKRLPAHGLTDEKGPSRW